MRLLLTATASLFALLLSGCSSGEGISTTDPQYAGIAGLIATALDNYASVGPLGLYPYMTGQVKTQCTEEQFAETVGRRPDAAPLSSIEKVVIDGDQADVTINLITATGDDQVVWKLLRGPTGRWSVLEVPGSEGCTP